MTIAFEEYGSDGMLLHFAHANGFPPGSYRQFLSHLVPAAHIFAMEQRPLWAGSHPDELTSWDVIAEDLLRFLDERGLEQVVGIGHSLGAVATWRAALAEPERFRALVLIEPVFLPQFALDMIAAQPETWRSMPLVQSAVRRRNQWESVDAAFERFRTKNVFARWSDEMLRDYLAAGLVENEDGVGLRFPREWEAAIYAKPPMRVWEMLPRPSSLTLAIRASESDTLQPDAWARWQEIKPDDTFVELADCGHLVPMERPKALADTILTFLNSLD